MEVSKHLEGAYALLIKSTAYPGELVACKRGSPLILGIKARDSSNATASSKMGDARVISIILAHAIEHDAGLVPSITQLLL